MHHYKTLIITAREILIAEQVFLPHIQIYIYIYIHIRNQKSPTIYPMMIRRNFQGSHKRRILLENTNQKGKGWILFISFFKSEKAYLRIFMRIKNIIAHLA